MREMPGESERGGSEACLSSSVHLQRMLGEALVSNEIGVWP